jgi:hypothetical protein
VPDHQVPLAGERIRRRVDDADREVKGLQWLQNAHWPFATDDDLDHGEAAVLGVNKLGAWLAFHVVHVSFLSGGVQKSNS